MTTITRKHSKNSQWYPSSGQVANDDIYLIYLVTPTKPASYGEIKWICCCSVLFCLCINMSFLLSFHFLLSFSFLMPLQPFSTNPYSNMNMLTSPFDQTLVMISQIQQLSRSNGWRICSTTNSECLFIGIPSERSKHATNAMHPNKYRTIPAVTDKPAHKSKLTESAKRQKMS